jgi:hypothetical protein
MICQLCGINETGLSDLCGECQKEVIEDHKKIDAFLYDGHSHHCACRLVWGDGECECRRQQNWIAPKPTTADSRLIANFDCPELHDYNREEELLALTHMIMIRDRL